jgi:hypothetical protein
LLNEPTLTQLRSLRLDGMLRALEDDATSTAAAALTFEQRLALLVQREIDWRDGKRVERLLKAAKLKVPPCRERAPGREDAPKCVEQDEPHGLRLALASSAACAARSLHDDGRAYRRPCMRAVRTSAVASHATVRTASADKRSTHWSRSKRSSFNISASAASWPSLSSVTRLRRNVVR